MNSWKVSLRSLAAILAVLALIVVAADALVRRVSLERFRSTLDASVSRALGLDVDVAGAIRMELLPSPHFEVEDVTLTTHNQRAISRVVNVGRVSFDIDVLPSLTGIISVAAVEIFDAELRFGPGLELDSASEVAEVAEVVEVVEEIKEPNAHSLDFRVRRLSVEKSRVVVERADGPVVMIELEALELTADDLSGSVRIVGHGRYDERRLEYTATLGSLDELLEPSAPYPVDARFRVGGAELEGEFNGTIDSPLQWVGLDLQFGAKLGDASQWLGPVFGWELPFRQLDLAGRLSNPNGPVALSELRIESDAELPIHLEVDGAVGELFAFAQVELAFKLSAADASALGSLIETPLPEGPLRAQAVLSDVDGTLGIENAVVTLGSPDLIEVELRGSCGDLREVDEIHFDVDLAARDLAMMGALFDLELPEIGPIEITGSSRGSDEELASRGSLVVGSTRFDTDWAFSFAPGGRRRLDAKLRSSHVRFADLGLAPRGERSDRKSDDGSLFERWWSGSQVLPLEVLRKFDLDVTLRAERLTGEGGAEFNDVNAQFVLDGGALAIRDIRAIYDGGRVEADLRLDARIPSPQWAVQLEAYNVDLTRSVAQFAIDGDLAGRLDMTVELSSRGSTRTDVIAALNGRVGAILREGNLASRYGRAVSLDFLRIAVPQFLQLQSKRSESSVHCLLAIAPIERGVARMEQLYLEGEQITVAGAGMIDLRRNQLNLRLAPRVHDPGLVSVAVTVDVSGPLEAPIFKPVSRSVASSAVRSLFDNAMRPVSGALQLGLGLGRESNAAEDVCAVAAIARLRQQPIAADEIE